MVNVKTQFSIKEGKFKRFANFLKRAVGIKLRNNFADLRPVVRDAIDDTVELNKRKFIPTDDEAFQLGIGEDGSIDRGKTNLAWTALKASDDESITTFSVRKKGVERGETIGEVRIFINDIAFFGLDRSVVQTPDSDKIDEIPWMQWFLFGKTITGSAFSSRQPVPTVSRTGGGIMVTGSLWDFPAKNRMAFSDLLNEVRLEINRRLKSNVSARILRRRR